MIPTVKEFWKSVTISEVMGKNQDVLFFNQLNVKTANHYTFCFYLLR